MFCASASYRSFSCSLRICSACAFSCLSLSSFSLAALLNCSKLSLEERTAEAGVDCDLWARLAQEPMFFSLESWRRKTFLKKKGLKKNRFLPELRSLFFLFYLALTCVFLGPTGVLGSCFILISCWPQDGAGESERQQPGWGPSKDFMSKPANKQFGVSDATQSWWQWRTHTHPELVYCARTCKYRPVARHRCQLYVYLYDSLVKYVFVLQWNLWQFKQHLWKNNTQSHSMMCNGLIQYWVSVSTEMQVASLLPCS